MEYIILLRGVTPSGKNAIPKMAYLVEILTEAGFEKVRTYIQSGNILLDSPLPVEEIRHLVHRLIKDQIGADLKMVIKTKRDLEKMADENPFIEKHYLYDRVHVILYQNSIQNLPLEKLLPDYGGEEICIGHHCLYLYLPRTAKRKKLNTNYLEKLFGVDLTMRKLKVIEKLLSK
ncbi:DUF1697 domain-containing protein [Streptococcus panodentis]|uniref:DUF1697 domain-containing protein n=1 Tax=Streptococcus panodentis TaxID=1581472 RepID=A0ABS5AY58_9STRE|nr:DUF1697 domain-containing protein [Streptococcus panodentis]MBP2620629.1 DUF1697 domain-containing protein [Streptococcus panodentis]